MKAIKYVMTALAGVALGGCASFTSINTVKTMQTTTAEVGTPFTRALTDEYRAQMNVEISDEYEWNDAAFFAEKGLRASKGEVVLPSDVAIASGWSIMRPGNLGPFIQIPSGRVPDLSAARFRLMGFLDGGGRDRQPVLAAHAQGLYDCWLEEEWEKEKDFECGSAYLQTEAQFTIAMSVAEPVADKPELQRNVEFGPKLNTFQVFFDFDRSNISVNASSIIDQVASKAKQHGAPVKVNLTGHTDASGLDAYNQALSERRAKSVMDELVKDGVPVEEISSHGVGKAGQLVPTADGMREPQNRRTEIILE